jgi:dTDP-4-dehydrorhamnose 3,5-epimerase
MVSVEELSIQGVKIITLDRHSDQRGWINESWRDSWSDSLNIPNRFVQDMLSWNEHAYTLRGLHALKQPVQQYKLVSVVNGKIFDVVVDARKESLTYGQYISVELSASASSMLLIPPGCYHGYLTLESNTAVAYKVSHYHSTEYDSGILWSDPCLGISWPIENQQIIISERDQAHPLLKDL